MNDQRSFERFVADNVAGDAGGIPMPEDFYDEMHEYASTHRHRLRWLALIKEPPMRISSSLAVGSPTVRVAAIMVATILLALMVAGAGIAGSRLLAADGTIVVDQSGNGDFTTITEAVGSAEDGDTILVRPGDYAEAFVIDRDITLTGDGPREQIIISGHEDPSLWPTSEECAAVPPAACTIVLDQTEATISGVTLSGGNVILTIVAGAPTVERVLFDRVGIPDVTGLEGFGVALVIGAGSRARIIGNEFVDSAALEVGGSSSDEQANPLIEGNLMRGGTSIGLNNPGDETVIRGNEISGSSSVAIHLLAASKLLIEDNVISDARMDAIALGLFSANGHDPVIRGNVISRSGGSAINAVMPGAAPTIEGNTFVDNKDGAIIGRGGAIIRGNDFRGHGSGITVVGGGDPLIAENTIDVSGRGIAVVGNSRSTLTGNTVCGGDVSIFVDERAEPVIDDTNVFCEAAAPR